GRGDPDVHGMGFDPPAGMLVHDLLGGLLQNGATPATDHTIGAQFHEALHHDPAQSGAPTGHQEALPLEQVGSEHRSSPYFTTTFVQVCGAAVTNGVAHARRTATISA